MTTRTTSELPHVGCRALQGTAGARGLSCTSALKLFGGLLVHPAECAQMHGTACC